MSKLTADEWLAQADVSIGLVRKMVNSWLPVLKDDKPEQTEKKKEAPVPKYGIIERLDRGAGCILTNFTARLYKNSGGGVSKSPKKIVKQAQAASKAVEKE
ncbi:hypothetical protein HK101_005305, partial [Irineochytrium annulatum]